MGFDELKAVGEARTAGPVGGGRDVAGYALNPGLDAAVLGDLTSVLLAWPPDIRLGRFECAGCAGGEERRDVAAEADSFLSRLSRSRSRSRSRGDLDRSLLSVYRLGLFTD
jgi:hypothetical protein